MSNQRKLKMARSRHQSPRGHKMAKKKGEPMIVQCPSCQTKFSVTREAIKNIALPRFHCSRCDHVFGMNEEQFNEPPAQEKPKTVNGDTHHSNETVEQFRPKLKSLAETKASRSTSDPIDPEAAYREQMEFDFGGSSFRKRTNTSFSGAFPAKRMLEPPYFPSDEDKSGHKISEETTETEPEKNIAGDSQVFEENESLEALQSDTDTIESTEESSPEDRPKKVSFEEFFKDEEPGEASETSTEEGTSEQAAEDLSVETQPEPREVLEEVEPVSSFAGEVSETSMPDSSTGEVADEIVSSLSATPEYDLDSFPDPAPIPPQIAEEPFSPLRSQLEHKEQSSEPIPREEPVPPTFEEAVESSPSVGDRTMRSELEASKETKVLGPKVFQDVREPLEDTHRIEPQKPRKLKPPVAAEVSETSPAASSSVTDIDFPEPGELPDDIGIAIPGEISENFDPELDDTREISDTSTAPSAAFFKEAARAVPGNYAQHRMVQLPAVAFIMVPALLVLLALGAVSITLRSNVTFASAINKSLFPTAPKVAPANLSVENLSFRTVTLSDGEKVGLITGEIVNDSGKTYRQLTLEGLIYSSDGSLASSIKVEGGAALKKTRVQSLTKPMIEELQSGKMKRNFKLAPGDVEDFAIVVLDQGAKQPGFYSARIYSVNS